MCWCRKGGGRWESFFDESRAYARLRRRGTVRGGRRGRELVSTLVVTAALLYTHRACVGERVSLCLGRAAFPSPRTSGNRRDTAVVATRVAFSSHFISPARNWFDFFETPIFATYACCSAAPSVSEHVRSPLLLFSPPHAHNLGNVSTTRAHLLGGTTGGLKKIREGGRENNSKVSLPMSPDEVQVEQIF